MSKLLKSIDHDFLDLSFQDILISLRTWHIVLDKLILRQGNLYKESEPIRIIKQAFEYCKIPSFN